MSMLVNCLLEIEFIKEPKCFVSSAKSKKNIELPKFMQSIFIGTFQVRLKPTNNLEEGDSVTVTLSKTELIYP